MTADDAPDSTAVRVALWRALHLELDAPPHVLVDDLALRLVDPEEGWRARPDMDPQFTRRIRAGMAARGRFVEDLVIEAARDGVRQVVILGAGVDTFAERRGDVASELAVYEVDRPGPQAWKRRRLEAIGVGVPAWLRLVPVDFEVTSWWDALADAGFDPKRPAVVASTGVTLYLTREANAATLRQATALAAGSVFATTFLLPASLVDPEDQPAARISEDGARRSGTPFQSLFAPDDYLALARQCGLINVRHVSADELATRYFAGRSDGLRPSSGEHFLVARL